MEVMIKCQCCDGTGKARIKGQLLDTLELIHQLNRETTIKELCDVIGDQPEENTMSQRLRKLERHGLVEARMVRDSKMWKATS